MAVDVKGRQHVSEMTDRQIAEETLHLMRAFSDVLSAIGSNPVAAAMIPGLGKLG